MSAALLLAGAALAMQAVAPPASGAVAPSPDSAWRARFQVTVDSAAGALDPIRGAGAAFRVDLPGATAELVLARAERLRRSCQAAQRPLQDLQRLLATRALAARASREQAGLRAAGVELRGTLLRCVAEWTASPPTTQRADSLEAWGPFRVSRLNRALADYNTAIREFQKAAGLWKPAPR